MTKKETDKIDKETIIIYIKSEEIYKHTNDLQKVCNIAQLQFFNKRTALHLKTVKINGFQKLRHIFSIL